MCTNSNKHSMYIRSLWLQLIVLTNQQLLCVRTIDQFDRLVLFYPVKERSDCPRYVTRKNRTKKQGRAHSRI